MKELLLKAYSYFKLSLYTIICKIRKQRCHFMFNTPLHGNIGDHAIIYAELKMLKKLNIKVLQIPTIRADYFLPFLKKNNKKEYVYMITGGGFIGSQWINEQNLVNEVISSFKDNKIVIFPTTIYFENNDEANRESRIFKENILNAKNIKVFIRERNSYEYFVENISTDNCFLVPDIVLSLSFNYNANRDKVILCFRKDKEGILKDEYKEAIKLQINSNLIETDTVVDRRISERNRNKIIKNKLIEFSTARVVITDRLHAMIFSYITKTPCIVFKNNNGKIEGTYNTWLKGCSSIKFVSKNEEIEALKMLREVQKFDDSYLNLNYNDLIETLKKGVK